MEHRQPGPEDTKNANQLHAARAEGIAAWLHSRRNSERQQPNLVERDDDDDEEEDRESGRARLRNLKIGMLPISVEERKESPKEDAHEGEQAPVEETSIELAEPAETVHEASTEQHDTLSDAELATLRDHEEDFRLWEEELRASGPEVGAADMQMVEEEDDGSEDDQSAIPQPRTGGGNASSHHQSRRHSAPRASAVSSTRHGVTNAKHVTNTPLPPKMAAGGGGAIPPMPPGGGIPMGPINPNGPFGPNNPNAHNVFSSPNTLVPATPNVLTKTNPNKVNDHEHKHGHPRLALAMAAAILVEHMIGKSADKRIEKASRERDDKLRKQIAHNKAVQEQTQQSFEARLNAEQTRQRQEQAAEHLRVNNLERTVAAGRPERAQASRPLEVANTNVDTELLERTMQESQEMQAEARARSSVVMEQVASAAESDQPVERVYERRQEVRDEPSNPAGAASGGAASVGSVLAKQGSMHLGGGQTTRNDSSRQQGTDDSAHAQGIDYRAAAIRGVGAGIAIIVLAVMAYLLF